MKTKKEHVAKQNQAASCSPDEVNVEGAHSEINGLKAKLDDKEKEAAANYDKYLRTVAELDNYKKRAVKEKIDTIRYGNEELIKDILPFVDSLDRAVEHIGGSDVEAFKDGIKLIREQFLCCLKKYGLEKIESAGLDFDPNFHEAMMQLHSDEHEENKIVNEIAKGYLLNGRLLRPSKVCVCKKINKENDTCEKIADKGQ